VSVPIIPDRSRTDVDALVTDRYLDALLTAVERRVDDAPVDAALDPGVRNAARVLRLSLVRVHPSFRFEERLASRLAGLAAVPAGRPAAAHGSLPGGAGDGSLLAFPAAPASVTASGTASGPAFASADADPLLDAILRGDLDPADAAAVARAGRLPGSRRPLIVGGAITSAAISLAGVAWVAWRASRPADGTITRAARIRRATAAQSAGGLGGPA
jgi:hypothetical protein